MGAEQHLGIVKARKLLVVDGYESHAAQTLTLHTVVDDVAQTIERLTLCKFLLGLAYGTRHSKAEPRTRLYLDLKH